MPSFRKLDGGQIDALLEYVVYLSIRGQTELYLFEQVVDEDAPLPLDIDEVLRAAVLPAANSWDEAAAMAVVPPPMETVSSAIARGRELFGGTAAQCAKCHGATGDGRGPQSDELYDDWNRRKLGPTPADTRRLAGWFRLPVEPLRPRNFTLGVFHGGDRPIDQYWRICVGIKGTPMPAVGPAPGSPGALKPEQIWDLVSYIRSLNVRSP
jgi:mono/diheme cytochrome c family protein